MTMKTFLSWRSLVALQQLLIVWIISTSRSGVANGSIVVSEVAFQGSSNACNKEDWVELYNSGPEAVDLTGYVLYDSKGITDEEAFVFPQGSIVEADSYLVLCHRQDVTAAAAPAVNGVSSNNTAASSAGSNSTAASSGSLPLSLSPQFGIGGDDIVVLARVDGNLIEILSAVGPLPGSPNEAFQDATFALDLSTGFYNYTSTPTPGEANVITPVPTLEEMATERKTMLAKQNNDGIAFFDFDRNGFAVKDAMDTILELKITMAEQDYNAMTKNPQYQEYKSFQSATVVTQDGVELLQLNSPGRIRTRGIEGVYMAACLGSPLPYRLDFDANNQTQAMFGVNKVLLRHSVEDASHMREWVYPRMLARFGLPHARTRMVHFYINDILQGFYTLMELPEQEYVFARNFPNYDPNNFALFQVTEFTQDCAHYTQLQLEDADDRIDEFSTPPYAFERGDHISGITTMGVDQMEECQEAYEDYFQGVLMDDVVLAYIRNDQVCAKVFLAEGLVDQELGSNNWDNEIEKWIEETMSITACEPDCANINLANKVNVDNFLKTFAFYAVTLNVNSPMGNVNNHYLAQEESKKELWNLVAYDFSKPGSSSCNRKVCEAKFVFWSISRPTCESLESNTLVGPLLTTLHSQYIEYVRDFTTRIYANSTFLKEIQNHAKEIEDAVKESFGGGASFEKELSPNAGTWDSGTLPLLPTMKARAVEVQKQLDALDGGTFARGPHSGATQDNEPWETCAEWQLTEADTSFCKEGCKYEGCFMADWTVPSFCDEATGTCYHGNVNQLCLGFADGDAYPGMEEGAFCRFASGVPVGTAECDAEGASPEASVASASSASSKGASCLNYLVVLYLAAAMRGF